MKIMFISLFALAMVSPAQEFIQDIGALTPKTSIPLNRNTVREDFLYYEVEAMNVFSAPGGITVTNTQRFNTTNDFLFLSDFGAFPSGGALLGIKTVTHGGVESQVAVYRFSIWRGDLPKPSAGMAISIEEIPDNKMRLSKQGVRKTVELSGDSLSKAISRLSLPLKSLLKPPPPVPPLPYGSSSTPSRMPYGASAPNPQLSIRVLPGGTNETYSQGLDKAAEKFNLANQ